MNRNELVRRTTAASNAYSWQAEMQRGTRAHRNEAMNRYAGMLASRFKTGLAAWNSLLQAVHDPASPDPRNTGGQQVSRPIQLFPVEHSWYGRGEVWAKIIVHDAKGLPGYQTDFTNTFLARPAIFHTASEDFQVPAPDHPRLGGRARGFSYPTPAELLEDGFEWTSLDFPDSGVACSSLAVYAHVSEDILGKAGETHHLLSTAIQYPGHLRPFAIG